MLLRLSATVCVEIGVYLDLEMDADVEVDGGVMVSDLRTKNKGVNIKCPILELLVGFWKEFCFGLELELEVGGGGSL